MVYGALSFPVSRCNHACVGAVGRQVRKSVKPVEQGLVQMVNKTDKHKHWLATRPTSLTTGPT